MTQMIRNIAGCCFLLLFFIFQGCKPDEETAPALETGTVADIDGNVYQTVKIGNQWWMAENLKTSRYRNGVYIPSIDDSAGWVSSSAGACCTYENGTSQSPTPGLLYNWYAVHDTGNIAPAGWHVPTDAEWKTLEQQLGMSQSESDQSGWRGTHEADKLRVESPKGWTEYDDVWSTNESGFTALAGSCRLPNAVYGQPGLFSTAFWWSLSEKNGADAWYRYIDYKSSEVFRSHESKSYGFSVRCIKD